MSTKWIASDGRVLIKKEWTCSFCRKRFRSVSSSKQPACSLDCKYRLLSNNFKRDRNPNWKGGRIVDVQGYVRIIAPEHRSSDINGYIKEHIHVAEKKIGRDLMLDEVVHHIDNDKTNNKPSNLVVLTRSGHAREHAYERWAKWKSK